ncbi:uncharacterized protein AB9W97_000365 [Spinachia spinachia]
MSKGQMLRCLVKQRLTEAAEEIFGLFERTIAEYEEEASRLKEDNERLKKRLHAVFNPEVRIQRAAIDLQQLYVLKEKQQNHPKPPHIKEEQEDQPLQGLEEADMKFSFTPVKREDEARSSHLHQRQTEKMETEEDGENCRASEPDRNSGTDASSAAETEDASETDDSDYWNETTEPQSGLYSRNNDGASVGDSSRTSEKALICSECKKTFGCIKKLKRHMLTHTLERPFSCSECGKCFTQNGSLKRHMKWHTGEKTFSCLECGKRFTEIGDLKTHIRLHLSAA